MRIFRKAQGPDTGLRAYGSHYARNTRWGVVVQKWPRKQPERATPYQVYTRAEWSYAGYWTTWASPYQYITAKFLSKGTDLLPRDVLMQAMYGSLYEYTTQDGLVFERFRDVAQNPQLILDMVTTTIGAILYRSAEGWVWVEPGNDGQVLSIAAQTPYWQDVYPVAVQTADLLAKTATPGLNGLRLVQDSDSVKAIWSIPGQVSFKRAALTGDVTAALDDNATTIANQAVTYAKIQNISTTKQLLGRNSSGSGPTQEVDTSQALDWLDTPAHGQVLFRGSAAWHALAPGTSGQFLKTQGASADPLWAAIPPPTSGAGTPISPYFNNADIHLVPAGMSGAATTTFLCTANQIVFVPITVANLRTFTKIAVSVPNGGNINPSSARLAIYNVDTTTGGPGTVLVDGGNASLATTGYQSVTINTPVSPGQYFLAAWWEKANTVRSMLPAFSMACVSVNLGAASPSAIAFLSRNATFGGSFASEASNTHTLVSNTSSIPTIGIR